MPNYLTYPCKVMRITQRYDGKTSHKAHMTGSPKDYSLDEGCTDGGRDWIYCCCDELKVVRVTGTRNNKKTNAIWLTSTSKCDLANGKKSVVTLQFVHPNDDDLLKIKEGQIFRRGDKICREGNDGSSANHLHMAVGLGVITNNGWVQNSNGKWVLTTTDGPIKPEDAFFIDPKFTKIVSAAGLKFKEVPKEKYPLGTYEVVKATAAVYFAPSAKAKKKKFSELTASAQTQIKRLHKKEYDGLVKGCKFSVSKVEHDGKYYFCNCPSGWVCLDRCRHIN